MESHALALLARGAEAEAVVRDPLSCWVTAEATKVSELDGEGQPTPVRDSESAGGGWRPRWGREPGHWVLPLYIEVAGLQDQIFRPTRVRCFFSAGCESGHYAKQQADT
jgi:hypothetical protein